ncbi:hypothetical protein L6R46_22650 [Myxococcota bacterium]|nr:hypothetical protein [Myxococcota bacterium]
MTTTPRAPRSPRNRDRLGAQRQTLLSALQECYPAALPLSRLRECAGARPGARVAELRRQGWQIATVCVEEESRLSTYRLLDLRPQAELEIHAAVSLYHDSAQGWHARVHADLSETYSPEELQDAAEEALRAFRQALVFRHGPPAHRQRAFPSREQVATSTSPDDGVAAFADWGNW